MAYEQGWDRGRRYGDEENRARDEYERGRRERDDRGFLERAGDEVRSWFGDDDAQRRRHRDERERPRSDWGWGERGGEARRGTSWEREPVDREWARQWGYIDRSERRSEWTRPERSTYEGGWRGVYGPTYGSGSGWAGQGSVGESYRDEPARSWRESSSWAGPHVGRGPRGYHRSDERIKDDLCEQMSRHGQLDASEIEVVVVNGEVTLQGSVSDRHAKRLAEDVAESVWGVREVHNQLRTAPTGFGDFGSHGSTGHSPDQPRRVA